MSANCITDERSGTLLTSSQQLSHPCLPSASLLLPPPSPMSLPTVAEKVRRGQCLRCLWGPMVGSQGFLGSLGGTRKVDRWEF